MATRLIRQWKFVNMARNYGLSRAMLIKFRTSRSQRTGFRNEDLNPCLSYTTELMKLLERRLISKDSRRFWSSPLEDAIQNPPWPDLHLPRAEKQDTLSILMHLAGLKLTLPGCRQCLCERKTFEHDQSAWEAVADSLCKYASININHVQMQVLGMGNENVP